MAKDKGGFELVEDQQDAQPAVAPTTVTMTAPADCGGITLANIAFSVSNGKCDIPVGYIEEAKSHGFTIE